MIIYYKRLRGFTKLLTKSSRDCLLVICFCLMIAWGIMARLHYCPPSSYDRLQTYGIITESSRFMMNSILAKPATVNHVARAKADVEIRPEAEVAAGSKLPEIHDHDPTLHCDRQHERTDVCVVTGDVRVRRSPSLGYEVLQVVATDGKSMAEAAQREERVRPYTRKWEDSVMKGIDEVVIRRSTNLTKDGRNPPACDVRHDVPAVVFSTGGYTGNVYHEFNDGLIPLFLTAAKYHGEVALVILEYHDWWMTKYQEIVERISKRHVIDYRKDTRVHCFREVTVGLRIHDELAINSAGAGFPSMQDFQALLQDAYAYRRPAELQLQLPSERHVADKPRLVIIARSHPRALLNQRRVASLAESIGFAVHVVKPMRSTEMGAMYWALQAADVMLGVHGAGMTHLLFMRRGATFIQVVPLGTTWAAEAYYGAPARKLGLDYVAYHVSRKESSLSRQYGPEDPVLADPDSVNRKGWSETKRIYLESQDVTLSLPKIGKLLRSAFSRHRPRRSPALLLPD